MKIRYDIIMAVLITAIFCCGLSVLAQTHGLNLLHGSKASATPLATGGGSSTDWCNGADINKDGSVNLTDLDIWKANFGSSGCSACIVQPEVCNGLDDDCNGIVDDGSNLCGTNATCSSGACSSCTSGFANCNGLSSDGCEVNLNSNLSNCGSCGHVCNSTHGTPTCSSGNCGIICSAGYLNCDGNVNNGCEVNFKTDPANCGGCGQPCLPGHNCVNGSCQ